MVIVAKPPGQLGNQLFQIAHLTASAIAGDYRVCYPGFGYSLEAFPELNSNPHLRVRESSLRRSIFRHRTFKSIAMITDRSPVHRYYEAIDPPAVDVGSDIFSSEARSRVVFCEGFYFRNESNLRRCYEEIRRLFQFSSEIRSRVDDHLRQSGCDAAEILVGFHIRRTDFRTFLGGERFIDDPGWLHWISEFRNLADRDGVVFRGILFSDEDVTAIKGRSADLVMAPGDIFEDLEMMSRCHYIVAPPSTFSGWASFVGEVPLLEVGGGTARLDLGSAKVQAG